MEKGKQLLGYLTIDEKDNYFCGAALVTDPRGIPVDFRYTEPVRPTRLERILYGGALDIYLREEVILENLIGAVEVKPSLWITNDISLIKPIQKISRISTLCIEKSSHSPLDQTGVSEPQAEKGVFLLQADGISSPLRLTLSDESLSKSTAIFQNLVTAAEEMELMEPFSRISKAMEAVAESAST
ncbi:MAG: hypothetical protein KBF14_05845 [Synergistaceae bacterium]|nr:hypothetical protein [Synergistaceae bacterium]